MLAAFLLMAAPPPDLTDPYNRAVAEWANCARVRIENEAATSSRRDMGVVDRAMRDCRADEDALRVFLESRSSVEEAERTMGEIRAQIRRSLSRYLRGLHR